MMHAIIPWQRLAAAVMELSVPLLILSVPISLSNAKVTNMKVAIKISPLLPTFDTTHIRSLVFPISSLLHFIERTPLLAFLQQVPPSPGHRRFLLLSLRLRHSQHRMPFIPLFPRKTAPSCSTWFLRSTPSTSKSPSTLRTFPSPFPLFPSTSPSTKSASSPIKSSSVFATSIPPAFSPVSPFP